MRSTVSWLLCATLIALAIPARAQINPFRGSSGAGLTASDFHMQDTTARKLTQQSDPHDGETRNWTNPRTGASGRVTVVNSFKKGDMLCRKLEFASKTKGQGDERTTQVNWCQTPQGWKIVSP